MDSSGSTAVDALTAHTYAGESVIDAVTVSGGTVGVTTHRVLARTVGGAGPNFHAIDRPNVDAVDVTNAGDAGHGLRAVRYGVYALALVAGSFLVDFNSVSTVQPTEAPGAGAVVGMAVQLTRFLSIVDDVLAVAGVVVLLVALAFAALYGHSRGQYLRVAVAGGDALRIPLNGNEHVPVDRLVVALEDASTENARRAHGNPLGLESPKTATLEKASNPSDG